MDDGCPVCLYLTRVKVLVGQYQLCRFPAAAWCGAAAGQLLGRHAHMFNSFQAWSPQPPLLGKCVSLWRPHSAVSLLTGPEPVVTAAVATVTVSNHSFPTLYSDTVARQALRFLCVLYQLSCLRTKISWMPRKHPGRV